MINLVFMCSWLIISVLNTLLAYLSKKPLHFVLYIIIAILALMLSVLYAFKI